MLWKKPDLILLGRVLLYYIPYTTGLPQYRIQDRGYYTIWTGFVKLATKENMKSSTKPEIHGVLQRYQTKTEPQATGTCAENLMMLEHVFPEHMNVDRQTDRQSGTSSIILHSSTSLGGAKGH